MTITDQFGLKFGKQRYTFRKSRVRGFTENRFNKRGGYRFFNWGTPTGLKQFFGKIKIPFWPFFYPGPKTVGPGFSIFGLTPHGF